MIQVSFNRALAGLWWRQRSWSLWCNYYLFLELLLCTISGRKLYILGFITICSANASVLLQWKVFDKTGLKPWYRNNSKVHWTPRLWAGLNISAQGTPMFNQHSGADKGPGFICSAIKGPRFPLIYPSISTYRKFVARCKYMILYLFSDMIYVCI